MSNPEPHESGDEEEESHPQVKPRPKAKSKAKSKSKSKSKKATTSTQVDPISGNEESDKDEGNNSTTEYTGSFKSYWIITELPLGG